MSSDVQHRLFNYSSEPPAGAWNGIVAALEETPPFARKLYQFEKEPPAAVWQKIALQLNTPETRIVPLRPAKLFKYAIAAAVLVAIAAGSIFYLKNSNAPKLADQPQNSAADPNINTLLDTQLQAGEKTALPQEETGNNTIAANESTFLQNAIVHFSSRVHIAKKGIAAREIMITPKAKNIINTELSNRYMIATTAAGNAVRLPKKAYSDYACADVFANKHCKEKIASIQSKMAASVSTDFTDFIDLLKKLQDKE